MQLINRIYNTSNTKVITLAPQFFFGVIRILGWKIFIAQYRSVLPCSCETDPPKDQTLFIVWRRHSEWEWCEYFRDQSHFYMRIFSCIHMIKISNRKIL